MAAKKNVVSSALVRSIQRRKMIVKVAGKYTELEKKGRIYTGRCPLHKELGRSFVVSPDRQTFECFTCGAGGDIFQFIREAERVQYTEAVKMLAGLI